MSEKFMLDKWLDLIGMPENYSFKRKFKLIRKISHAEFDGELYKQNNGPGTSQKTLLMFPPKKESPFPLAVLPFYYPDLIAGFDLETLKPTSRPEIAFGLHLVRRGFAVITAESYYQTYKILDLPHYDFKRWSIVGDALEHEHPEWSGIGKLVADTRLLIDVAIRDPRIDSSKICIAGHSLGGKMAFYTGCIDTRIKAILASDFGIDWDRTNWNDSWYWGKKLEILKKTGMDHSQLLAASGPKPFMLIAGSTDNADSFDYMERAGYRNPADCSFINHATGHTPPANALAAGYEFLEKHL